VITYGISDDNYLSSEKQRQDSALFEYPRNACVAGTHGYRCDYLAGRAREGRAFSGCRSTEMKRTAKEG
jgi:hypothetical protein